MTTPKPSELERTADTPENALEYLMGGRFGTFYSPSNAYSVLRDALAELAALRSQVATLEAERKDAWLALDGPGIPLGAAIRGRQRLYSELELRAGEQYRGLAELGRLTGAQASELETLRAQLAATPDLSAIEAVLDDPGNWYDEGGVLIIRASVKFALALTLTRASQPKGDK